MCGVVGLGRPLSEHYHDVLEGTIFTIGSPEPCVNQDGKRKGSAEPEAGTRAANPPNSRRAQTEEIERLTLERDLYSKTVLTLEDHNRKLTEAATQYSLWGQKLERELARIDPDGAPARR
jgi:hypothetical protein